MARVQSMAIPPTPTYDRFEEELDQIFFGKAPYEPDADTEAAARGGPIRSRPNEHCRKIWQLVCGILDQGIDAAREKIAPTAGGNRLFHSVITTEQIVVQTAVHCVQKST